ncbi:MAG: electron transfer flavoprotein subunit alpha/FixB family protein [Chloroflexi bacterium]|nr:electron transfer flavoprotein subunit alpha/FixB family protein [Chloroflexota bacterium]
MAGQILVFIEHYDGEFRAITQRLLSIGREQAECVDARLAALVLGHKLDRIVGSLSEMNLDTIFTVDEEQFETYNPEICTRVVSEAIGQISPRLVLFGDTHMTREIAPAISVALNAPFLSGCLEIELTATKLVVTQPKYSGSVFVRAELEPVPGMVMASVQSGVVHPQLVCKQLPEIILIKAGTNNGEPRIRVLETTAAKADGIDIAKASIIVAGGRGLKAKENLPLIRDLAEALGGAIACSRPLCDLGWLPAHYLVGMSGKTVSPSIYIACGISGATQHLAGMSGAKCVIAINNDASAPIYRLADYGVARDLLEILPAIIKEAQKTNT